MSPSHRPPDQIWSPRAGRTSGRFLCGRVLCASIFAVCCGVCSADGTAGRGVPEGVFRESSHLQSDISVQELLRQVAERDALIASLDLRLHTLEDRIAPNAQDITSPASSSPALGRSSQLISSRGTQNMKSNVQSLARAQLERKDGHEVGENSRGVAHTRGSDERLNLIEIKQENLEMAMQNLTDIVTNPIRGGDIAWMMTSTALVLTMTIPGLALFYGGMVRVTNVLSTLMQCFSIVCLITIEWMIVGYSLAFSEGNAVYGDFKKSWLLGVSITGSHRMAPNIPEPLFMCYELMFAIITPALICGAFADRMRLLPMLLFMMLWHVGVYCPLAHAMWHPNGFLHIAGVIDFAGGSVVHIAAGCSGLMSSIVVGKRTGFGKENFSPHNILVSVLGASLLWVGWFGFNAGSYLCADLRAPMAMAVTQISTAMSTLTWMATEWFIKKRPSVLGIISGTVAGLVAITPAAGSVDFTGAFFIGLLAGPVCFFAAQAKHRFGYDDALDAFGIHGPGGILGGVLTGVFATEEVTGKGSGIKGCIYGGWKQLGLQFYGCAIAVVWSCVASWIMLKTIDYFWGLRVALEDELTGLDMVCHGENLFELDLHGGRMSTESGDPHFTSRLSRQSLEPERERELGNGGSSSPLGASRGGSRRGINDNAQHHKYLGASGYVREVTVPAFDPSGLGPWGDETSSRGGGGSRAASAHSSKYPASEKEDKTRWEIDSDVSYRESKEDDMESDRCESLETEREPKSVKGKIEEGFLATRIPPAKAAGPGFVAAKLPILKLQSPFKPLPMDAIQDDSTHTPPPEASVVNSTLHSSAPSGAAAGAAGQAVRGWGGQSQAAEAGRRVEEDVDRQRPKPQPDVLKSQLATGGGGQEHSGLLGYAVVPPAAQSSAQPSAQPHELKNLNGATYWHATATLATASSAPSAPSRATAATAPTTLPATLPLAAAAATSASHAQATTRALPGVQVPTVPPLMYPSNVARASSFSTRTPFDAIEGGADAALDDQVGDA